MSECLTDELLARFLDERLTPGELSQVHDHMDDCPRCRGLILKLVHRSSSETQSAPAPTASWTPPAEFDEFRLVRPLGRGAMGVVYLAEDIKLRRQVAVKFIAAHQPGARVRERFQKEAQAIAQLQHPNVVTVFRTGQVGDHPYIVTEYLEGQTLDGLALPLPWRRALALGVGLVRGLAAAHEAGVLHRDLKPSNAFLTQTGEVKLLDFGLAEFDDPEAPAGPRTLAGTPRYMAPELFRRESATPQSDLYALGLVLYQLCTGTLPERTQLLEQDVPLAERVPGIDPDFAALILRCLQVSPQERYGSAEALRAVLEQLHVPEVRVEGNPYRGLAPFEAEHRTLFFGRDADIQSVLERLRRQPLVLIAGDSGVGKSSLCRAGLLPQVQQGALDAYRHFTTLTLEPGRRPLSALAAALGPFLKRQEEELGAWLAGEPGRLGPALRAVCAEGRGLLLFVDQLEELITLSEPTQAEHFARLLGELGELTVSASGVRVLLTVRGDFVTRAGVLPGLDTAVERALYLLRPLTPEGVREAIVGPARSRGVAFESEAIRTLVGAMARGAGSLPLLQFALAELWERRDTVRGCITQASLEAMGGVAGALSRHADAVLARLNEAEQLVARRMLGHLITAEGTRSERGEEELLGASPEARPALRALVEGRLLHARTVGGRATYEIAHEALIASWDTLRHWLDEDAGQRALRQRIEAASAEWERLGRTEELLWRKRQLSESRAVEATSLGAREQDFLRTSQRAVRRQRLRLGLAAGLIVLGVAALTGGPLLRESLETQRFLSERMAAAEAALAKGRELARHASETRRKALLLFDGQDPEASQGTQASHHFWPQAQETWAEALEALRQADTAHSEAGRALDDMFERVIDHAAARELRIALTYERILLAEEFHRKEERARFVQDFERLTARDRAWRERLEAPAGLEIKTTPPGARVELWWYEEVNGVRRRVPVSKLGALGTTPLARVSLQAGSYHLRFTREGHAPVDLPLLLERGKTESVDLVLPSSVPEGTVYIPPGCSLLGSADPEEVREFMHSAPLHPRCLSQGYFIGRTEVTVGEWLEYLESPAATEAERHLLATPRPSTAGALSLEPLPGGGWRFTLHPSGGPEVSARDGELLRYPGRRHRSAQDWRRFPLAGVSVDELAGFLAWLDRSGRLPGARLCSETEWTRAARGADDRRHPHGNRLQKDDANIDVTYDRQLNAFGPDEVGSHPASESPFGLQDLAGNAFEITQAPIPDLGDYVILGGAWYFERIGTFITNRQAFTSSARDVTVGVRLCASWRAPPPP